MVSSLLPLFLSALLATATLPQLFQKAKTQFKLGAYGDALATLGELDAESSKPGLETQRQAVLPGLLFYKGASFAAMGKSAEAEDAFEAFLTLEPGIQIDPALYPKPVIAALETARKNLANRPGVNRPEETGVLATAYRAFVPPPGHADESSRQDWADGPVRWLLTPEEKRAYADSVNPISRSELITNFWRVRDPRPDTPENEFREEFDKRVAFADARFAQDEVRGSLTDRGMVFVLMGPPTYSGRRPLKTGDDSADAAGLSRYTPSEIRASEQMGGSNTDRAARQEQVTGPGTSILDASANWIEAWHYERVNLPREIPNQALEFDFVTKVGYGKNVLQRDQAILTALERSRAIAKHAI
jgi:GWxTD domain-containing protein